jgi:hypothetical protein
MDEIALLQQQLAAVQQQESALKLSDHNVIDLLLKLQQLGKVQLVHTLSGTQFLTPAQIEREVADHVTLSAGRMSLSELQRLINVDRAYIDKYVAQLAKSSHAAARKSGGSNGSSSSSTSVYYVINLGEEVVTNWYLDAIMEDTNTLLKDSGTLTVGELAQQYGFAVDYMKEVVQARIGSVLRAQERGNVLYTDSYVAGQKAQIRGVFAATTRPTFVPDVVRAYGFEDEIVDECLAEMLQSGVLMGALRGREYVPYVFMEAQRESMYSFFQQNGYLEHSRAAKLQVARPFDFLKKRFPDAVPLDKSVVSAALQLQVEGSIEATVSEGSFLDVTTVVPSAIAPSDVALLLRKSALLEQDKTAHVIRDVYVVSSAFINGCVAKVTEDAAQKATKAAAEQQLKYSSSKNIVASSADGGDNEFSDEEDAGGKRGAKGKGKRGGKASKQTSAQSEEPASNGKAKGGAKGKRGKRGGNDDAPAPSKRKADKSSASSAAISIVPTREELATLLVNWFPQLEDFQDDEEFMGGLAEHLEAEADRLYSAALAAALSSILRGDAASLRDLRKKFEDRFDDLLSPLLVLEKGFNKLSMHVDAKDEPGMAQLKVVEAHVLDTAGTELAALVTSYVAEANILQLDGVPPFSSPTIVENHVGDQPEPTLVLTALSEENKKALEKNLPASTATAVVRLWTLATAGRRSLGDLMVHVPALADALSMPLRKFDRKKERQVVFANRHALVEQLDRHLERGDAVAGTSVALQLLFQQCTGLPARFPTDHVTYAATVLKTLVASVPPEAMTQFQRLVDLANAIPATPEEEQARTQLLQDVRALVTMKDIGAAS